MCIQAGASEIGFVQRCNLLHRFGSPRLAKRIGRAEQLEDAQVVEKDANRFRWLVERKPTGRPRLTKRAVQPDQHPKERAIHELAVAQVERESLAAALDQTVDDPLERDA